jgi:hypothetical protein
MGHWAQMKLQGLHLLPPEPLFPVPAQRSSQPLSLAMSGQAQVPWEQGTSHGAGVW